MIAKISALINERLSDLGLEEQSTNQIIKNSKLSFSDNLDKAEQMTVAHSMATALLTCLTRQPADWAC